MSKVPPGDCDVAPFRLPSGPAFDMLLCHAEITLWVKQRRKHPHRSQNCTRSPLPPIPGAEPKVPLCPEVIYLYRPVGAEELALIKKSGFARFPPRLPGQPIFYPVLNEEYATQVARDWNAKYDEPMVGYVTRFRANSEYLKRYEVRTVGGSTHQEYWIPAEELDEFNRNIVGLIEVIAEYRSILMNSTL